MSAPRERVDATAPLEAARPADYLSRLAASELGRSYKALVIDEMAIEPGSTVVDLGCGPGADLTALAAAVGPSGRVLGIDNDERATVEAARVSSACAQVEVRVADIHRLDLADRSADRIHTDRVLQHVRDPDAVVAETARVLRPGGVAAFAEPDWDTLVIDFVDPETPAAYRRFITDRVVRNSRVGRQIPRLCERNGLRAVRVLPVTAVYRDVSEADKVLGLQRVTDRAVAAGYLSTRAASAWLTHLRSEELFASVSLFVTLAEAPAQAAA
ncbi:MAG: methyltransferase domain-containing protein [Nocardioidaceae bacterium]